MLPGPRIACGGCVATTTPYEKTLVREEVEHQSGES
jgi:hypothetical protein